MEKKFKRIGILGGTFNPIHLGHLALAEQAREALCLKKVIFVPANLPPHKKEKALAPAQDRYRMVALAVKSNPFFEVCDLEIKSGEVSYSVKTVKVFRHLFPQTELFFLVGSDFLKEFSTWKDINEINKICRFAVIPRPGHSFRNLPAKKLKGFPKKVQVVNIDALNISSTEIRRRILAEQSIRYLLPEEVRKYIAKKRLYA